MNTMHQTLANDIAVEPPFDTDAGRRHTHSSTSDRAADPRTPVLRQPAHHALDVHDLWDYLGDFA